jgi:hypothetical protein
MSFFFFNKKTLPEEIYNFTQHAKQFCGGKKAKERWLYFSLIQLMWLPNDIHQARKHSYGGSLFAKVQSAGEV